MEVIAAVVVIGLALGPIAAISGWLTGSGERPFGALMHGRDTWWRSTMPWPQGVQEEDSVHWHVRESGATTALSRNDGPPRREAHSAEPPTMPLRRRPRPRLH
jgi:hypothetical protein